MPNSIKNVLLLDFWTDKNRGDAAMQLSLIDLTSKYFKNSEITICTAYGSNQINDAMDELDLTKKSVENGTVKRIIGGIRPTYFSLKNSGITRHRIFRLILDSIATLVGLLLLFALAVKIPASIVRLFMPRQYRNSFDIINETDVVVWNGRNFRGDTYWKEPYSILALLHQPLVCILLNKRIGCIGSSVWQLQNPISKSLLRYAFKHTNFISIREENSFEIVKELMNKKMDHIYLLPDLSFHILKDLKVNLSDKKKDMSIKIGLTVVDWKNDGQDARESYIKSVKNLVSHIQNELNGEVIIVPQVTYGVESTEDIVNRILEDSNLTKTQIVEDALNIEELVKIYNELDFLIATRMHSAIFALSIGTPVLALAYDHGGKWGILDMMGVRNIIIDFDKLNVDSVLLKFKELWETREVLMNEVKIETHKCFNRVDENITKFINILEESV